MNVVDSTGWLEYFADARNADFFAPVIQDEERLLVPTNYPHFFHRSVEPGIGIRVSTDHQGMIIG